MAFVCHMHQLVGCVFVAEFIAQALSQAVSQVLMQALCFIVSLSQTQRALLFIVDLTADPCSFHRSFGIMCDHAHGVQQNHATQNRLNSDTAVCI